MAERVGPERHGIKTATTIRAIMYNGKKVTVIFPAYNEETGIYDAVTSFLSEETVDEVIVIDNNSIDGTAAQAVRGGALVLPEPRQGYGFALRRGLKEACGDLIILCEPDGTFIARDVNKLLPYSQDFEMVLGTRTNPHLIWDNANMGWFLRVGNLLVAKLQEFLFNGPSLTDCGCTFRLLSRAARDQIQEDLTVGGSHFLPEVVILALQRGISLIEIPLNYRGRVGKSKITGSWRGVWVTGMNMIKLIFQYRFGFPPRKNPLD